MNKLRFIPIATPTDRPPAGAVWLYVDSTSGVLNAIDSDGVVTPAGTAGTAGQSAYDLAVELGYEGTEEEWIESLQGAAGAPADPAEIEALQDRCTALETYTASIPGLLDAKAPLASPALTGNPTAPTQALGNNSTRLATTAFVVAQLAAEIQAIVGMPPSTLDTLQEIAARIVSGESDIASLTAAIAAKVPNTRTINGLPLSADVVITATMLALGNVNNTSDTNKPVSTAQQTALNLKANLASPVFTGAPAAPTAAPGTNNTTLASTAFVQAALSGIVPSAPHYQHIYIDAAGNDGTALVGNPLRPFQTGNAAYTAGITSGQPFVLEFGCGTFSIETNGYALDSLCCAILGQGAKASNFAGYASGYTATSVAIYSWPAGSSTNNNGANGGDVFIQVRNVHLNVYARGQNVIVNDMNTYQAGSGGMVVITGHGSIGEINTSSGVGDASSTDGSVSGNSGNHIRVLGQFSCQDGAFAAGPGSGENYGSGSSASSGGAAGDVTFDSCDIRGISINGASSTTFARCLYVTGAITPTNDAGGNTTTNYSYIP